MIRNAEASIIIRDLWDGIDQDTELFIIKGNIYKKLEIHEILELTVTACVLKVKPINNKIEFIIKTDGVSNPDFNVVFDETYQKQCAAVDELVSYTFSDSEIKTLYFTGRIGFELTTGYLKDVIQWGDHNTFCYFSKFFKNCTNKSISAYDKLNLSDVTSLFQTFYNSAVQLDMNIIDTSKILDISHMYNMAYMPNLKFRYPTFCNVMYMNNAFSNIAVGSIDFVGLKFPKILQTDSSFDNSELNGEISNCMFGNDDQTGTIPTNPIYNATKLFHNFKLNGSMYNNTINSSTLISLFDNYKSDGILDINSFKFKPISNANRMFYQIELNELTIDANINTTFIFNNGAITQELFSGIKIINNFNFKNIVFGNNQLCANMFTNMLFSSATISNINFKNAIMDYMFKDDVYIDTIKNIKLLNLNTTNCTSFISTFENNDNIILNNPNILNIDTSNATTVSGMWKGCKKADFINMAITTTKFQNVIDASSLFEGCENLSVDLSAIKFPKLKYSDNMFKNCKKFNSSLASSNMVLLEYADYMFENCFTYNNDTMFSQNLISAKGMLKNCQQFNSNINFNFSDTAQTYSKELFMNCYSLNPASDINLNLSRCLDVTSIFENCKTLNCDINLDTEGCLVFDRMFVGTSITNSAIITLNTLSATSMKHIFAYTKDFNADLTTFNTPNVLDFSYICFGSSNFGSDLGLIEFNNATNLSFAFSSSNFNNGIVNGINNMNVSKVTTFESCFDSSNFNQTLNWSTPAATTFKNMFRNNYVFNNTLPNINVDNITTVENMFLNCIVFNQDLNYLRFKKCRYFDFMFYNATSYQNKNMSDWLDNTTVTGISHVGFLKTNTTNIEPIWV